MQKVFTALRIEVEARPDPSPAREDQASQRMDSENPVESGRNQTWTYVSPTALKHNS